MKLEWLSAEGTSGKQAAEKKITFPQVDKAQRKINKGEEISE